MAPRALEILRPEVPKFEQFSEEPTYTVSDDDGVRFGDRLKARREVRRLADTPPAPGRARAERSPTITTQSRSDPHLQGSAGDGFELRRRFEEFEPCAHRAFRVVFMGLRIAEIGQHAVAHVFGDETAVALNACRRAPMVGADDVSHVLGVEPARQRCRADEIAEHHCELATLGLRWGGRGGRSVQLRDRGQQLAPMADADNAEILQIIRRKVGEDLAVDFVVAKRRFVLSKTEISQPPPDVHGLLRTGSA